MPDGDNLNPDIRMLNVGKKALKEVEILPLSVRDQVKATKIIVGFIQDVATDDALETMQNIDAMGSIMKALETNIDDILDMVTEEGNKLADDLTNNQLAELANHIFEVNYDGMIKNFKDLFGKVKEALPSKRS